MSRYHLTNLLLSIGVTVALVACSGEVWTATVLTVLPGYAKQTQVVRLANDHGDTVTLLGTIHTRHIATSGYSLRHVRAVVEHVHPSVLIVESRPEALAPHEIGAGDGPIEMPYAVLAAACLGIQTAGMDWWLPRLDIVGSSAREDSMWVRITAALPPSGTALVLTGYSHLPGFVRRFEQSGFHTAPFSSLEIRNLFDTAGISVRFPSGFAHALRDRIRDDSATLPIVDRTWRPRVQDAIAVRKDLIARDSIAGEDSACDTTRRSPRP